VTAYNEETGKGLVRHVLIRYGFKTKESMVCLVINGDNLPHSEKLVDKLTQIEGMTSITYSVNRENTNVIMGKGIGVLWGQGYITDYIGDVKYQISPLSFFQVNPAQTEKLYGLALEYADLKGEETVWDLYCGIGTISLFLAQKAEKVYGVEIVPQAIDDARNNARINAIENAEFFVGKAEEVLPEYYAKYEREHGVKAYADVIVVDPPRKGCDETLLQTMVQMRPERIVYVSCDSATLARDLKYLCENGYEMTRCRAVDQFPMTTHCEVISLLQKTK
jgi:23S rRNA (uracil1939-C5)-methyltransferase